MDQPKVGVITRTKNRAILLARALESVASQTCKDLEWVIINDGGETSGVDRIASDAKARGIRTTVIHNPESLGMEAASNRAIRASSARYLVIHDDDDSWEPDFAARCAAELDNPPHPLVKGVITHAMKVNERIEGDTVIIDSREPFNNWLANVSLYQMTGVNTFPPISFMFSREAYDKVGGYDEKLPVLGDWDFNLRFLRHFEITVVPELLANYHHRPAVSSGEFGNSIYGGRNKHIFYDAMVRNQLLRREMDEGRAGYGLMVNLGRNIWDLQHHVARVWELEGRLSERERQIGELNKHISHYQRSLAELEQRLAQREQVIPRLEKGSGTVGLRMVARAVKERLGLAESNGKHP